MCEHFTKQFTAASILLLEKILHLQKAKRELADAIITSDNSVLEGLTREHLELLLE